MAYSRTDVRTSIVIPSRKIVYSKYFEECKLDHELKRISSAKNTLGNFVEPLIVPELVYVKVPKVLFEEIGIYSWFKYSFPNCKIEFW